MLILHSTFRKPFQKVQRIPLVCTEYTTLQSNNTQLSARWRHTCAASTVQLSGGSVVVMIINVHFLQDNTNTNGSVWCVFDLKH